MAFQTASVAINVIAPVGSHCAQRPRALALRSLNHSTICVRGLSARENWSDTDGAGAAAEDMDDGMDEWVDRGLITTVDALNADRIERMS